MKNIVIPIQTSLEHDGATLGRIHSKSNNRKALAYWLGFLKGVLASETIEVAEFEPLRVEAANFLNLLQDPDAGELLEDLRIWENEPKEVYEIVETIVDVRSRQFVLENDKDEINELYGFCAGIACDNHITIEEAEKLLARINHYSQIQNDNRIYNLKTAVKNSIADGRITPAESDDICSWIIRLVGDSATDTGIPTFGNVGVIDGALENHEDVIFDQRMFVLTGKFSIGPRKAIQTMISERGGAFKGTVCKKTHYLCVATEASRDWKHSHEGLKIMRAMELRDQGDGPALVHEGTLARAFAR